MEESDLLEMYYKGRVFWTLHGNTSITNARVKFFQPSL